MMGRVTARLLLVAMIASMSVALANAPLSNAPTQTATVSIPQVAMLRFKTSSTSSSTGNAVDFGTINFGSAAASTIGTPVSPIASTDPAELQALVNKGTWGLGFYISSQGYTDGTSTATDWTGKGMSLGQFKVSQDGTQATGYAPVFSAFSLDTSTSAASPTDITTTAGNKTDGWKNVGISEASYTFTPTGLETPGTYTVTVAYVIVQP